MVIKVMVIDDHRMVREAVVRMVSGEPDLEVVGAAADAGEGLRLVECRRPDVVTMDIHLTGMDGITATRLLCATKAAVRVVILSASCSTELVRASAAAGACGYLVKGDPPRQLLEGIRAAARGGHPMSDEVARLGQAMVHPDARSKEGPRWVRDGRDPG